MAKAPLFTLDPKPTFKLPIEIPRPGENEPGKMTFTVRYRRIFADHAGHGAQVVGI